MTEHASGGPADRIGLRERLQASGAKPHRRMSDLSRYMLDHRDELDVLVRVERYGWADLLSAILADDDSLRDDNGNPITLELARLTWSRLNRRKRGPARSSKAAPSSPAAAAEPLTEERSTNRDDLAAVPASPSTAIRPARPRGRSPASASVESRAETTPSLLSDDEVEQRIADLAGRQGGQKIPPPEVL